MDGEVVKKLEHLREIAIIWNEQDTDKELINKFLKKCMDANKDHKKRTLFWNKYKNLS